MYVSVFGWISVNEKNQLETVRFFETEKQAHKHLEKTRAVIERSPGYQYAGHMIMTLERFFDTEQ